MAGSDSNGLESFEKRISVSFDNERLLREAFTHRSYLNENREPGLAHNERLEFLGDAVLELVVTRHLFDTYPQSTEGDLTSYRSALVNAQTLSEIAQEIGMNDYMLLSRGEAKDTGRARQFLLANALEALVGAIYLDQGYDAAAAFIGRSVLPRTEKMVADQLWRDAKSLFQEKAQDEAGITPAYQTISESGPDHDKKFVIGVYIGKELVAKGEGKSKQEAEQEAARKGLEAKGW